VRDPFSLDWAKVTHVSACFFLCFSSFLHFWSSVDYFCQQAKRMLKNLRVKASPSNQEYKITGLSEKTCKEQMYAFLVLLYY
jgi:hypothetical protein